MRMKKFLINNSSMIPYTILRDRIKKTDEKRSSKRSQVKDKNFQYKYFLRIIKS